MRVCVQSARPDELNHELLWLTLSVGGSIVAGTWLALGLPWPHCLFLALTGHPCLTCGATRAAIQFFHGHFLAALRWNPLAFISFWAIAFFDTYAVLVLVMGWPRLRLIGLTNMERMLIRIGVVAALALNWIYLLVHWQSLAT